MKRVTFGIAMAFAASVMLPAAVAAAQQSVRVFSTVSCGCCTEWAQHLRTHGFEVEVVHLDDLRPVKGQHAVAQALQTCHTAIVGGYVIEGHVPAADIQRLLRERPADVVGLAVPGMPAGSPGMEGATRVPYDVLAFDREGRTTVYARHGR